MSKTKNWTKAELKILKGATSGHDAAEKLGRSVASVQNKATRMGISLHHDAPLAKSSVIEDVKTHDEKFWRRHYATLQAKYDKLAQEQTITDRLVANITALAPRSYSPRPAVKQTGKSSDAPQSAVLMFSDTHIGKTTKQTQTLSFGNYNFKVFMARLKCLEESVISISKNHITTEVPELVIAMLGDMLDGALSHSNEVGQADPIFNQFYCGAHAIAQFFRNLAPHFPKLRIYDTVGNHCVDEETEILTRRGWLKHTDLKTDDECLGLARDGKTAVWQRIDEVVREKQVDRMVSVSNRQFSFRGTEHHRFYYFIEGHPMMNEARWSEIKRLPIQIPAAGFCPGDGSNVPDNYIELCAAVLTDGSISKEGRVIVYQKPTKEGWVKSAFEQSGLEFTRCCRTRKAPAAICGRPFISSVGTTEEVSYHLQAGAARSFLAATNLEKGKLPTWVWSMTNLQFKRFLNAVLLGDGTGLEGTSPTLFGKSERWLGEIQALCALHGIASSVSKYQPNNSNPNPQFRLNLNLHSQTFSVGNSATVEVSEPTGETVWCVRTSTENFFCRRNGKSYFTGNTRFQNQRKMPTKNRYSNFDNFLYALVRELVRDIPNIEWKLDAQPYEIFEVNGFTFFAAHGDSLRGGDKTLGVPNHAVGRLVSTLTQMMNKYGRKAPNYYLVGHLHRDIVLPHATGSFLVNGGFPGVDEYGLSEFFTPADPTQKLFYVHPKYGKTATYDIALKFAEPAREAPYEIPAEFEMR